MGFSGGFKQGKPGKALLELILACNSKINCGQIVFLIVQKLTFRGKQMAIQNRVLRNLFLYLLGGYLLLVPMVSGADDPPEVFSLNDAVKMALDANLNLKRSQEEVRAAEANRKASVTQFFPTLSASYDYVHRNKEQTQELTGIGAGPPFRGAPG